MYLCISSNIKYFITNKIKFNKMKYVLQHYKTVLNIFFVLFCISSINTVKAQDINFEHLGIQNGLSQLTVNSIYQDQFGMMWFGTREGINRYDGYKITSFYPHKGPNALPGNIVNSIVGDESGNIYFVCDGKLVGFDHKSEKFNTVNVDNVLSVSKGSDSFWVLTDDSLFKFTSAAKSISTYCKIKEQLSSKIIFETAGGRLLLGGSKGLYLLEGKENVIPILSDIHVVSVYEDRRKNLWISTEGNGFFKLNKKFELIKNYRHSNSDPLSLSSDDVRSIIEDKNGTVWIGTFTGLNKYIEPIDNFQHFSQNISQPGSILHSSVLHVYCDLQGTIWLGTYYGGVNYFNPDINIYNFHYPIPNNPKTLNNAIIGRMAEDDNGNLWIGTDGGGVNYLNRSTREFSRVKQGDQFRLNKNIKVLLYVKKYGVLLIGTHFGGLEILNVKTGTITAYNIQADKGFFIADNAVYSLAHDGDDVYVSTRQQLYKLSLISGKISEVPEQLMQSKGIWNNPIFIDSQQNLWYYPTYSKVVKKTNLSTGNTQIYSILNGSSNQNSIGITSIMEDSRRQIWLASNGGGLFLYDSKANKFKRFQSEKDGLISNYCYDLAETKYGNILISTNKGLSVYQNSTGVFKNLRLQDGVPLTAINEGNRLFVASDGEIFWGGINGLVSFYEQQISNVNKPSTIHFSELEVNNRKVEPGDNTGILKNSMLYTEKVSFKNTDTNISIFFASSNYIKANACEYEYFMHGLNDKWIKCNGNRIDFSNLSRGDYVLKVRGKYLNTNVLIDEIKLDIRVNPPFYTSTFALWFYFIVIASLFYYWLRFYMKDVKLKSSLEFEKKENERIEAMNKSKLQFFTNISHEFRTPITLIMGQIESLLESKESSALSTKLLSVYKNTSKLNHLLSELLDFRKQEQGYLNIKVKKMNLVDFVYEIFLTFNDFAFIHKIHYRFECAEKEIFMYFDPIQLQKVFNNLLSNAFKFTKSGGEITLRIINREHEVELIVNDNGIGIPQKDIENIFDRFYQVNQSNIAGTGIGLALAKGIVDLHGGKISAQSTPGVGSAFEVVLKQGNSHFNLDQILEDDETFPINESGNGNMQDEPYYRELIKEFVDAEHGKKYKLLIVDDNEEIIQILATSFQVFYRVEFAINGKEGLEKASKFQPDIILTDLMMPIMSGSEMLVKLKSNIETSHIPVVMITANTSDQYLIEGLQYGADDYITKPFNIRHLVIRCNNLVRSRKLLKEKYTNELSNNLELITYNKLDQEFMEKVLLIVEKHFDREDFTVDYLASSMNIGRNKVYSKIKGITGLTPNDFILNIKLKKAAYILKNNPELSIGEVAYQFGFGTPQYFSKCFKKNFGITPLDYRKEGKIAD
jgi:signal transduction histidine kinase/DNA-binding response OmpR family regulator/ligand-binding sensor domain-containing protein